MSKKDFDKGIKAGIKISEELVKKEVSALEYIKTQVDKLPNEFSSIHECFSDLAAMQNELMIKELFGIAKSFDYKNEMEPEEKIILLAMLQDIKSKKGTNEEQNNLISRLRSWLEVSPQDVLNTEFRTESIDNIDSKKTQKAIYQVLKEFLFLETKSHEYLEDYSMYLDCFSLKKTDESTVETLINLKYKAFGLSVFWEQFGEIDSEDLDAYIDEIVETDEKEDLIIAELTRIAKSEKQVIANKNVELRSFINIEGELTFKFCNISYKTTDFGNSPLMMGLEAKLNLEKCNISCSGKNYLIQCGENSSLVIDHCVFENSGNIISGEKIKKGNVHCLNTVFKDCYNIVYSSGYYNEFLCSINQCCFNNFQENEPTYNPKKLFKAGNRFEFYDCNFSSIFNSDVVSRITLSEYSNWTNVTGVVFGTLSSDKTVFEKCCFNQTWFYNQDNVTVSKVSDCKFHHCYRIRFKSPSSGSNMENCLFENSNLFTDFTSSSKNVIRHTVFDNTGMVHICCMPDFEYCTFKNFESPHYIYMTSYAERQLVTSDGNNPYSMINAELYGSANIHNSIFENIHLKKEFIFSPAKECFRPSQKHPISKITIDSCEFINCTKESGPLIQKKSTYEKSLFSGKKEYQCVILNNCSGIEE